MTSTPAPDRFRIAVTIGDPAGIGPEVALKALADRRLDGVEVLLAGPRALWEHHVRVLGDARPELALPFAEVLDRVGWIETSDPRGGDPPALGRTNVRCGAVALAAIEHATRLCLDGGADALVTAPISKQALHAAGSSNTGHTELLRDLCRVPDTTMAFVGGGMRVALATVHVPLRRVFDLLTPELIVRKARHLHDFVRLLGVPEPRLALCGLNPHASEEGLFGSEERDLLLPALHMAHAEGIPLAGPFPPDTIFHEHRLGHVDAVLALYHDQGLIAVKTVAFDAAVNITLGLPIVRTSPDHGTAFDIAGRGIARDRSFAAAFDLAVQLAAKRRAAEGARS